MYSLVLDIIGVKAGESEHCFHRSILHHRTEPSWMNIPTFRKKRTSFYYTRLDIYITYYYSCVVKCKNVSCARISSKLIYYLVYTSTYIPDMKYTSHSRWMPQVQAFPSGAGWEEKTAINGGGGMNITKYDYGSFITDISKSVKRPFLKAWNGHSAVSGLGIVFVRFCFLVSFMSSILTECTYS